MKMIRIKKDAPHYKGKKAAYEYDMVYPNGNHVVHATMMTGAKTDTWGGVPMVFPIEEVEFLFDESEREYRKK